MENLRRHRLASLLQREIRYMILYRVIKNPAIHPSVSISHVLLNKDLHYADVYIFSESEKQKIYSIVSALNKSEGFIRNVLGKKLHLRYIPRLNFKLDNSYQESDRINQLLDKIK